MFTRIAALLVSHQLLTHHACSAKPMNFVFSFPDTLRAESFNSYGLGVPGVTPHTDKFAAEGVRFEQAHVMHTQCSPSRCTMLTGRYMHLGGHRTQTHLIQDYEPNYFRTLKENGYYIRMYGKNDAFSGNAMNLSVTEWGPSIGFPSGGNAYTYGEAGYFSFLNTGSADAGNDTSVSLDYKAVVDAVNWMKDSPPQPFLLYLPSRGAHPPYGAPVEYHNRFPVDLVKQHVTLRARDIENMPVYMSDADGIPHHRNLTTLSEDTFYKIQSVYLGMISYTDWIFGELLAGIEEAGLTDNTAVFFSSDHGDFAGDYGLVEKWPGSLADILTRVPLMARIPGGVKGHVSKAPVQTADILETMLDLAEIKGGDDFVRFGVSFKDVAMNGTDGDEARFVYSEGGFYFENEQMIEANECLGQCPKGLYCPRGQEEAMPNGSPKAVMVRNSTAKLVYRPTGVSELYDLVADPRETQNLYHTASAATLRSELVDHLTYWMVVTSDVTPPYTDSRWFPSYPYPRKPDSWAAGNLSIHDYFAVNGVIEGKPLR